MCTLLGFLLLVSCLSQLTAIFFILLFIYFLFFVFCVCVVLFLVCLFFFIVLLDLYCNVPLLGYSMKHFHGMRDRNSRKKHMV